MRNAYIAGTGYYLPPRVVTNEDLCTTYGIDSSDEWIRKRTGIDERRFADEGWATSDMAKVAAERALDNAGITTRDVDMIIFCTLSPDHAFPGAAPYLQRKLGMCDDGHFPACLDVRNQCSGFLYGLATGTSMVQSGGANNVLLVGAECHSAAMDFSARGRNVCSLFGDAAGCVVIRPTDEDRGLRGWVLGADGRFSDALCQKVWDTSKRPYISVDEDGMGRVQPEMLWAHMEGRLVFKHAIGRMTEVLHEALRQQGLKLDEIDLFLFHQANLRINQMVQQQLGAPAEKFPSNIQKYGNTTAATIPLLLAEAVEDGTLQRGMKVAMVAFGSGFTWGCAIMDW